jgi:hypothetical protein
MADYSSLDSPQHYLQSRLVELNHISKCFPPAESDVGNYGDNYTENNYEQIIEVIQLTYK